MNGDRSAIMDKSNRNLIEKAGYNSAEMDINDSIEYKAPDARKFTSIHKAHDFERNASLYKNEKVEDSKNAARD